MAITCRGSIRGDIVKAFEEHAKIMGIYDRWSIRLVEKNVSDLDEDSEGTQAETGVEPEYRIATIDLYQDNITDEEIPRMARHELLHVVVWVFFDIAQTLTYKNAKKAIRKLEEQVVTDLETMPLWELVYEKMNQ